MTGKIMLEDELKKSRNRIIQIIISKNKDFFKSKVESRLNRDHSFSYNQVDESFISIVIDDESAENTVLGMIKTEVETNERIAFDGKLNDALKKLLQDILLHCVENEKPGALKKILLWLQDVLASLKKMRYMIEGWDYEKDQETGKYNPKWDGLTGNCPAMIRACEKDNFQMVSHFLCVAIQLQNTKASFRIDDSEFKQCEQDDELTYKNKSKFRNFFKFPLLTGNYEQSPKDLLYHYKAFYATSKPAYLIAKSKHVHKKLKSMDENIALYDPISEAYHNLHIARVQSSKNVEYKNKFNIVKKESKEFIIKMLNRCNGSDEARLFMQHDCKLSHYFNNTLIKNMSYPRLEIAEAEKHEEFVGHDLCQQILREHWLESDVTGNTIQWNSSKMYDKMMYCLSCVLLMPFHIIAYHVTMLCGGGYGKHRKNLADNRTSGQNRSNFFINYAQQTWLHLSYPINRFIAHSFSYVFFLAFLLTVSENPEDDPKRLDPDWYDFSAGVMAVGFFVSELREFSRRYDGKNFRFWNVFDVFCYLILIASHATKSIGFFLECKEHARNKPDPAKWFGCTLDQPHEYGKDSAVVIGYSLFGVGLTLCFSKMIYFCQIFHTIGPIAISIKRIVKDIFLVAVSFLIFLQAFGLGIFYLMKGVKNADDDCHHNLHQTGDVYKSLFWNLFDPVSIEDFGCSRIEEAAPRYLAMFLFGMFLLFNVLILMNALIAIMNSTLNVVNKDKMMQWKYERTAIWLRYLDSGCVLPCPFNLLEMFVILCKYLFGKCNPGEIISPETERLAIKRYLELVEKLSTRYLHQEEDSDKNDITKEDLENLKQEMLNAQNQH